MQLSRENSSHLTWNEEFDDNEDNSVLETKKTPDISHSVNKRYYNYDIITVFSISLYNCFASNLWLTII